MRVTHSPLPGPQARLLLLPALIAMALGGCATQEYVHQEVGQYNQRISSLESWFGGITQGIDANAKRVGATEARMDRIEQSGASLAARLDANRGELAGVATRLDSLAAELAAATRRMEAGSADTSRAHQRIEGLEARLNAATRRGEGTVAGLALAERRIGALENSVFKAQQSGGMGGSGPEMAVPSPLAVAPVSTPPAPTAAQPVPPAGSPAAAKTTGSAGSDGGKEGLGVMLAEANQKLEHQGSLLNSASGRLSGIEAGLAASGLRTREQEAALTTIRKTIGDLQSDLVQVRQKVEANAQDIARIDGRVSGVDADLAAARQRVEAGEKVLAESGVRLTMMQELLKGQGDRLSRNEVEDGKVSATALEALERARLAGKLAEGKLVFETTLADEITDFGFDEARLGEAARQQLNDFANRLKAENRGVFIEIQGHTDNLGPADVNLRLSRERAVAVRDFLNQEAGIPLHRLAIAAYGETKPVADNKTREGRGKNRRVVLVVLK